MRKHAVLAVCAAAAVTLTACGSAQRAAPPAAHHALTPKIAARRDPQTLLTRIAVPPAAKPAPELEAGLLGGSVGALAIGTHRVWQVPQPYPTVLRFFEQQHPRGAVAHSGMLIGLVRISGKNRQLSWSFRPIRPFLSSRRLTVTVLALSPRSTGVRVEVDDIWRVRPASERMPAGVRTITIRRARSETLKSISRRLTKPAQVRQVVTWFNALPLFKPSTITYHCPAIFYRPPTVITFLSAGDRVLAQASISGSGMGGPCQSGIAVTVRGRPEPMLAGDFLLRVYALLGLPSRNAF